ncbi:hypothetical protein AMTR_s00007p00095830 [Amborella trichopoda]|uniref:Uncharacterized protein n=1 Tax=Amborella trichopoda TaxID=13333 RepID=W1PBD1_AMBTC|nr:hypothetical protein AMTR_s00007p00095830 [Amborella trichopoda]
MLILGNANVRIHLSSGVPFPGNQTCPERKLLDSYSEYIKRTAPSFPFITFRPSHFKLCSQIPASIAFSQQIGALLPGLIIES